MEAITMVKALQASNNRTEAESFYGEGEPILWLVCREIFSSLR